MRRVLGVFAKEPRPGEVKSRLAETVGPDQAARLYECFLRDFLTRIQSVVASRVVAYTPDSARNFFASLVGSRFELDRQSGGDLGERMGAFFRRSFAGGACQVVLVGSDSPHLPIDRIEQAFEQLANHDVVLGPSEDGGYYLVGMRRLILEVFSRVAWSTSEVLAQTMRRLESVGVTPRLLEPFDDIDRPDDLARLASYIAAVRRAGRDPELPHTEAVLAALAKQAGK